MCTSPSLFPSSRQGGTSLVELIMFIMIIGIALAGIMLVMNQVGGHGSDTLARKQALTIAESLLEEIEAQVYSGGACTGILGPNAVRAGVTSVCDYDGFNTTSGVLDMGAAAISGLEGYNIASIQVTTLPSAWGPIPSASAVQIIVTVTDPVGDSYQTKGYRTAR